MCHVHYHHPKDEQFSLNFVNDDLGEIGSEVVRYDSDVSVKIKRYDLSTVFYVVYTSRFSGGAVTDMEFNLSDALAEMDDDNATIVARLFELYRAILSENEEQEGTPIKAYKKDDIEAIGEALNETAWEGSATDVAGCLASNLILKHGLPNANHRTAIAMIQSYLRRINLDFSMPETKLETGPETYNWREWVNEYINESKRILTIRQNNIWFKYLRKYGATKIERKHQVMIELDRYELDMYPHEAKEVYAEKHQGLWRDFVKTAIEQSGYPELKHKSGLSKASFAKKIRGVK